MVTRGMKREMPPPQQPEPRYTAMLVRSIIAFFLASSICLGQNMQRVILPDWTIVDSQSYAGKQLYGYINGGAELYHEYGFVRVDAVRMKKESFELTVEVYEMGDARSAFGIYSIYNDSKNVWAPATESFSPAAAASIQGKYMIRLSLTPPDSTVTILSSLMRTITSHFAGDRYRPAPLLSRRGTLEIQGFRRLIFGPLGVQNAVASLDELVDGLEGYTIDAIDVLQPGGLSLIARISFQDAAMRGRFLSKCGLEANSVGGNKWSITSSGKIIRACRPDGTRSMYFVEASSTYGRLDQLLKLVGTR